MGQDQQGTCGFRHPPRQPKRQPPRHHPRQPQRQPTPRRPAAAARPAAPAAAAPAPATAAPPYACSTRRVLREPGHPDGPHFDLEFPCELNNTDYLRRLLAQVTYALKPAYRTAVLPVAQGGHGCPMQKKNTGAGWVDIAEHEIDAFYALKHLIAHPANYSRLLGTPRDRLLAAARGLTDRRYLLAHENLNGVSHDTLEQCFCWCSTLAVQQFAVVNLASLRGQYEAHRAWKASHRAQLRSRQQPAAAGGAQPPPRAPATQIPRRRAPVAPVWCHSDAWVMYRAPRAAAAQLVEIVAVDDHVLGDDTDTYVTVRLGNGHTRHTAASRLRPCN